MVPTRILHSFVIASFASLTFVSLVNAQVQAPAAPEIPAKNQMLDQPKGQVQIETPLAAPTPAPAAAMAAEPAKNETWLNRFTWGGDMRFRLQKETGSAGNNDRARIRARLRASAKVNEQISSTVRLTTGGVGGAGSNYTTNSNLGGVNSKLQFDLDLAFIDYHPVTGLQILLGKSPTQFWAPGTSEIAWGFPWSQEGLNMKYVTDLGNFKPTLVAAFTNFYESGGAEQGRDNTMLGIQAIAPYRSADWNATLAFGSYDYANLKGTAISKLGYAATALSADGNTLAGAGTAAATLANDYRLLDVGAEIGYNLSFAPISIYYNYVMNQAVSEGNKGQIAGVKLGALKDQGSWMAEYNYRDVEADAAIGMVGETQYLNGGTNVQGHLVRLGYQGWKSSALGIEFDSGIRQGRQGELYMLDWVTVF